MSDPISHPFLRLEGITKRYGGVTALANVDFACSLGTIHAEAPAGRITFGFDADLNVAMGDALDAMVSWMQVLSGAGKAAALALASTCVDLRITQVANQTWGVHAVLPPGVIG